MPFPLDAHVLTVDTDTFHKIDTSSSKNMYIMSTAFDRCAACVDRRRRLEYISWRLWKRETSNCAAVGSISSLVRTTGQSSDDKPIPRLSGCVHTIVEEAACPTWDESATNILPRIKRQDSCTGSHSRGYNRSTPSADFGEIVVFIVKEKQPLSAVLPASLSEIPSMESHNAKVKFLTWIVILMFIIYSGHFVMLHYVPPEERYRPLYSMFPSQLLESILLLLWQFLDLIVVHAVRDLPMAERACIRKSETIESILIVLLVKLPQVMNGTAFAVPESLLVRLAPRKYESIVRFIVGFTLPMALFLVHRFLFAALATTYAGSKKQRDQEVEEAKDLDSTNEPVADENTIAGQQDAKQEDYTMQAFYWRLFSQLCEGAICLGACSMGNSAMMYVKFFSDIAHLFAASKKLVSGEPKVERILVAVMAHPKRYSGEAIKELSAIWGKKWQTARSVVIGSVAVRMKYMANGVWAVWRGVKNGRMFCHRSGDAVEPSASRALEAGLMKGPAVDDEPTYGTFAEN